MRWWRRQSKRIGRMNTVISIDDDGYLCCISLKEQSGEQQEKLRENQPSVDDSKGLRPIVERSSSGLRFFYALKRLIFPNN